MEGKWTCLNCDKDNIFRQATKEEAERSRRMIEINPYAKDLPEDLKDVWCDYCNAHNSLIKGKAISCSGGKSAVLTGENKNG